MVNIPSKKKIICQESDDDLYSEVPTYTFFMASLLIRN